MLVLILHTIKICRWRLPEEDRNIPIITNFKIYWAIDNNDNLTIGDGGAGSQGSLDIPAQENVQSYSATISLLPPETYYRIALSAENSIGESSVVGAIQPRVRTWRFPRSPKAPDLLAFRPDINQGAVSIMSIKFFWQRSTEVTSPEEGTAEVTGYRIYWTTVGNEPTETDVDVVLADLVLLNPQAGGDSPLGYEILGLEPGTRYRSGLLHGIIMI